MLCPSLRDMCKQLGMLCVTFQYDRVWSLSSDLFRQTHLPSFYETTLLGILLAGVETGVQKEFQKIFWQDFEAGGDLVG